MCMFTLSKKNMNQLTEVISLRLKLVLTVLILTELYRLVLPKI